MLCCKTFEVRDRATFIACFAVKVTPRHGGMPVPLDDYLLWRCGYAPFDPENGVDVLFGRLDGSSKAFCDPHDWRDRTFATAHEYVRSHFDDLHSGAVVDVEFILGETSAPKRSESETSLADAL